MSTKDSSTKASSSTDDTSFVYKHFLMKEANFKKLATREDPQHIHKTLGILSVCSFIYRYGYVYNTQGNLGFDGMGQDKKMVMLDWATMIVHTTLALSSILFRVPGFRIPDKPMVIYEEYRQHAMVFTTRCFAVFVVAYLFPDAPCYVPPIVVMTHHLMADRITSIWGRPGNTAVRATSDSMKISEFYKGVSQLYSFYQFLAIGSHIVPNARLGDMAYNAIIAIQSSAFMMTLYRKRIIRGKMHMVMYASCLVLSAFHIIRILGLPLTGSIAVAFLVRTNIPRNLSSKYAIWLFFLLSLNREYILRVFGMVSNAVMELNKEPSTATLESLWIDEDTNFAMKGGGAALAIYLAFSIERALFEGVTKQIPPSTSRKSLSDEHED